MQKYLCSSIDVLILIYFDLLILLRFVLINVPFCIPVNKASFNRCYI